MTEKVGTVTWINGPVIRARGSRHVSMLELVEVGEEHLVGEVIGLEGDVITAQVYEETSGMRPGAPVFGTGLPLSVELGPGLLTSIFDGVQRPLPVIEKRTGSFIGRGDAPDAAVPQSTLELHALCKEGRRRSAEVRSSARCRRRQSLEHRVMVPPGMSGTLTWVARRGRVHHSTNTIAKVRRRP